jgi:hypothetical protein
MENKRRHIFLNLPHAVFLLYGSWLLAPLCLAAPTIGPVSPAGATRGSEVEVLVSGANFHEAQEIFLKTELFSKKR